jgi:hypothetical protein
VLAAAVPALLHPAQAAGVGVETAAVTAAVVSLRLW